MRTSAILVTLLVSVLPHFAKAQSACLTEIGQAATKAAFPVGKQTRAGKKTGYGFGAAELERIELIRIPQGNINLVTYKVDFKADPQTRDDGSETYLGKVEVTVRLPSIGCHPEVIDAVLTEDLTSENVN